MALLDLEGFDNDRLPNGVVALSQSAFVLGRAAASRAVRAREWPALDHRFPASSSFVWHGAVKWQRDGSTIPPPDSSPIVVVGAGTLYDLGTANLTLYLRDPDGVSMGRIEARDAAGNVLGITAGVVMAEDVWLHVGIDVTINGAAGAVRIWLNGEEWLNVPVANLGAAAATRVRLGGGPSGAPNSYRYWNVHTDDLILLDKTGPAPLNNYLGDCRVATLRPDGEGASKAWIGSDGNSVANWQLIDDNAVTTDYIRALASATGARDLSTLTTTTFAVDETVYAAQLEVLAAKTEAGDAAPLKGVLRSPDGSTTVVPLADAIQLSTSYQWFESPIVTAAPDAGPWTVADLDTLEVGVEVG